jgi:hypothetical protein
MMVAYTKPSSIYWQKEGCKPIIPCPLFLSD